jgi:hypothetical protein
VEWVATGWMAKGSEFKFQEDKEFSCHYIVQTGSGAHHACYPMGTGSCFPWGKAAEALKLITHLQLVLSSRKYEYIYIYIYIYIYALPILLKGVVFNWLRARATFPFF